jgi:putative radical SAM enzyme (TIGR03279 family)
MNPGLRAKMLGSPRGANGVAVIRRLAGAGITMNCQIVLCPGINDGAELEYSMSELAALYPEVNSVSVVPVGLTRHREGLPQLTPFDAQKAAEAVRQVEAFAQKCLKSLGSRIFFCADELYIKAERELPPDEYYEGYPQLENGVGMLRLLIEEFNAELRSVGDDVHIVPPPFTLATGRAAEKFIESLLCTAREICDNITGEVVGVANAFFGESVDVAGLVTGGDILKTLQNRKHAPRLLLPRNMLRVGETRDGGVFLDDVTVRDIETKLNVTVRVVEQDGADLLRAVLGE